MTTAKKPGALIFAHCNVGGFGYQQELPWASEPLPLDLKHFKEITLAVKDNKKKNAVIMGKNTWLSLPKSARPFKDRINIIITRADHLLESKKILAKMSGVYFVISWEEALERVDSNSWIENFFVIGGEKLISKVCTSDRIQKAYVTNIRQNYDFDTRIDTNAILWKLFKLQDEKTIEHKNLKWGTHFEFQFWNKLTCPLSPASLVSSFFSGTDFSTLWQCSEHPDLAVKIHEEEKE